MTKLTVVIVYDFASINGGQARVAIESAIGLKQAGHRPIYFAAVGPVAPELTAAGVEVHCLDQLALVDRPSKAAALVQGTWNSAAGAALDRLLATLPHGRTVVHVHGWAKALSPSIGPAIRRARHPALYTMHEYFQVCPTGGFYDYKRQSICHLKPLSLPCWARSCDARSHVRKIWRNARLAGANVLTGFSELFTDYLVFSDFQKRIVAPYLPRTSQTHILANPIGIDDLGPRPRTGTSDFLFVGRLSPEKGPLIFAEAARRAGVRPVFVGDGPLIDRLRSTYPEARLLGWRDSAGVRAAMRAARALVFPSIWYEGQPLTVLEAKALGVPVIVSDACAGRQDVEDGVTGLWFKSGDADDLAGAMNRLRDDAYAATLSEAAHTAYWAAPQTLTRHTQGLERIYRGVLAQQLATEERIASVQLRRC